MFALPVVWLSASIGGIHGVNGFEFEGCPQIGAMNRTTCPHVVARMIGALFSDWRMFSVIDMLLPLLLLLVAAAG